MGLTLHVGYITQIMRCFYILLLTLVAAGLSQADLGEIDDFYVVSNTEESITVGWTLGPSDEDPVKYHVAMDNFFESDETCTAPCEHTFEMLKPCSDHGFTVQAFYWINDAPVPTKEVALNGSTQGAAPDAPTKLVAIDYNHNVDLSWTPPENVDCVDHWQVCYHLDGTVNKTCVTTNLESITLSGLDKCANMKAEVRGVTPDGVKGNPLFGGFDMGYGDPSDVRNLVVGKVTNSTVELKWDVPITNPLCVDKYDIVWGPVDKRLGQAKTHDHHATISDLFGCTNYSFGVSPVVTENPDYEGGIQTVTAETDESYPLEISDLQITYDRDPDRIFITWAPNTKDNCTLNWKICYNDEINPGDTCFIDDGSDGEFYEISLQLEACTKYDVGVAGVSPNGLTGNFTYISIWTWDEIPSEVQNLQVENVDVNLIEISYDDPAQNARCVDYYDVTIDDGETTRTMNTHHDDFFTDLEACTPYEIGVTAITRQGYNSSTATCQATTSEGPVSAPRSFGIHDNEKTETSINLIWYEPEDNSKCTGSYTLTWTGTSDGSVNIPGGAYQIIHTVDALECDGEYDFELEATSISGVGSGSPVKYHETTLPCAL